jgi:hypothetical protein
MKHHKDLEVYMAYSDFDLKKVKSEFGLKIVEIKNLFSGIENIEISDFLAEILKQNVPLSLAIGTEKASYELIIINIFLEIKKQLKISFFSGIDFTVDKDKGLNGFCDFILSKSPEQLFLDTPIVVITEAKNEKIMGGLGQCIAEMIAAQIYNEKEGKILPCIYGAVTTGYAWKFLKLEETTVYIDIEDYYIKEPHKIISVLIAFPDLAKDNHPNVETHGRASLLPIPRPS